MSEVAKLAGLLHKDARGIYRDHFMLFLCGYPVLLVVLLRVALPWIPIAHMDVYLAPVAVMLSSNILGFVLAFALIEEREQQTWLLLRVLPLRQSTLFGYLGLTSTLASFAVSLVCAALYGLAPVDPGRFLAMAAVSALVAPFMMLLLGAAAANKIEGLAIGKIVSSSSLLPALVFVLPPAWQLLLVWSPWYWIYLGLLRAFASEAQLATWITHWPGHPGFAYVLVPTLLTLVGSALLVRIHRRRV